jgi:hypothetical protein
MQAGLVADDFMQASDGKFIYSSEASISGQDRGVQLNKVVTSATSVFVDTTMQKSINNQK